MSLRLLAAGLMTALPFAADLTTAAAADLFDPFESGYPASPYDDPRYADIYRKAQPSDPPYYGEPPVDGRYERPYDFDAERPYPGPRRYAKPYDRRHHGRPGKDRWRDDYLKPLPRTPDFDPYAPRKAHLPPGCLSPRELHRELIRDGWSGFHDFSVGGKAAFVNARRPNGTLYRLEVDRCDGEVVSANRIEGPSASDSYAWRRRKPYPTY